MDALFSSKNGQYRVVVGEQQNRRIRDYCLEGWPNETGGVLVGHYTTSRDTAIITAIEPPPTDSRHGRTWFERGIEGLRKLFQALWERPAGERQYYLGEWHLHPSGALLPSRRDRHQMQDIADGPYECPEPLLAIARLEADGEFELGIWIFRRGDRTALELTQTGTAHRH